MSTAFAAVRSAERDRALDTIVRAFADDPVERWLYPEPSAYAEHFPGFVAALAGSAFEDGTVWASPSFDAVAVWLRPGADVDGDAVGAALVDSVSASRHPEMFDVLGQMDEHHPRENHWYLSWLAVSPSRQGDGLGSRLLRHCLDVVDRDGLLAYLETPNPRTVPLYERNGFVRTGTTSAPTCPPLTFMSRPSTTGLGEPALR